MEPSGVIDSREAPLPAPLRPRWLATLAVAILITGCGPTGAAPSLGPSAPPSGAPTTAAPSNAVSPAPTTSPAASLPPGLFRLVGDAPVIARTIVPDRSAILPGAVAFAGGVYHAWVIAFADTPGTHDIHHLTSPDAVRWSIAPDASLEGLSEGLGNPGAFPTSVLPDGDGWVMYFTGTLATEQQGWEVRRATAPGPDGPWTGDEEPVLRRGPAGAWDSGGLDFPSVIRTDDGYRMLFSGTSPAHPEGGSIGLATSSDGITWTKHDDPATGDAERAGSDPVIEPDLCGGFDSRAVHQPRMLAQGDRLVLAYAGYAGPLDARASIGFADSHDGGVTWQCVWPSPALDPAGLPTGFIHTIAAFPRGDRLALLVEWLSDGGTDVWLTEALVELP